MNEDELYIADHIKTWVWSGFYDASETNELVDDILDGDVDEALLRALIDEEFEKKAAQEKDWPSTTDCDRLDAAFQELNDSMVIALQYTGYSIDNGLDDVAEIHAAQPPGTYQGYCFYHGQDLERAIAGQGLMLAYGDMIASEEGKAAVAATIIDALQRHGLVVEWNGSTQTRINLPGIRWQRR